jgi:hypothetical protein
MLRWNLCSDAIEQVNELTLSGKYPDKTDLLADTWKYLVNKRNELRARTLTPTPILTVPLKSGPDEPLSAAGSVGSFEPPFFDRETMLGALQNFLNSPEKSCFVLSGIYAAGPTGGLMLAVFGERWNREGAPFLTIVSFSNLASTVESSGLTCLSL